MNEPRKLGAKNDEDLTTNASNIKDAIAPIVETTFPHDARGFMLITSRFGWENAGEAASESKVYDRTDWAVRFDDVDPVKRRNIDHAKSMAILSSLAIQSSRRYIDQNFPCDGTIRLAIGMVDGQLDDLDHRWPTRWRPSHERG